MNNLCRATPPEERCRGCLALARPRYELLPLSTLAEAAHQLPRGLGHGDLLAASRHRADPRGGGVARPGGLLHGASPRRPPGARPRSPGGDHGASGGRRDRRGFRGGRRCPRPAGDYADGLALLEALSRLPGRPARLGVPAYPEGHGQLEAGLLQRDLDAKARLADYAVTQMCFESAPLLDWLRRQRAGDYRCRSMRGFPA